MAGTTSLKPDGHRLMQTTTEPPGEIMARAAAADVLQADGRADLAAMVRAGQGDDFSEVRAARAAVAGMAARLARYEAALRQYAEADFWDEDWPGGPLSGHDRGEMATNVLAGKPAFFHRD